MIFNIIRAIFQTTVPLGYIRDQQMFYQTLGIFIEISRELDLALKDLLINGHGVIIIERVNSCNHFVSQNSECLPIDRLPVSLIK